MRYHFNAQFFICHISMSMFSWGSPSSSAAAHCLHASAKEEKTSHKQMEGVSIVIDSRVTLYYLWYSVCVLQPRIYMHICYTFHWLKGVLTHCTCCDILTRGLKIFGGSEVILSISNSSSKNPTPARLSEKTMLPYSCMTATRVRWLMLLQS